MDAPIAHSESDDQFSPSLASAGLCWAICARGTARLRFLLIMREPDLRCDGCGRLASPEHIARRLRRLEWSTRYRPVHIGTLLLGAIAPLHEADFIYSPAGNWRGEAKNVLSAVGLTHEGKPAEALLSEFQRGGFFLTHVLECPLEDGTVQSTEQLLADRFPAVLARIRRSLKPKRLAPISQALEPFLPVLKSSELPCTILLDEVKPFMLDREPPSNAADRLRAAIAASQTSQATGA